MFSDEEVKSRILLKLYKRGKWGGAHTSFENLKKGWNIRDLGKKGLKRVNEIGEKAIKEGLLISKPTSYGLEVSLNPSFSKEILDALKKFFPTI